MAPEPQNAPTPRKPQESKNNWRLLVMFAVAAGLLGLAFVMNSEGKPTEFSFPEFKEKLRERLIYTGLGNQALKIVTEESALNAHIKGYVADRPLVKWEPGEVALVRYSSTTQGDRLPEILREKALHTTWEELPLEDANTVSKSISELRKMEQKGFLELDESSKPIKNFVNGETGEAALLVHTRRGIELSKEEMEQVKLTPFRVQVSPLLVQEDLRELVIEQGIATDRNSGTFRAILVSMLPILLLILLLFFLFRHQMKSAGRGAMNFGKSKARLLAMDKSKVTFKDVAGIQEAKEELWEIVEFLRNPKKFQKLGGSIPKGVLMVGAPGTGKTLLARSIAGEADVPFFSISGSDFVEMFVGVGASRVRDMFEQGKKQAPCLIFIDEIDAVGRHRGHGLGGGHDEREQTLNALLVEMDGFDTQEGVIIIAATNRPDVLDPALLRPGRFDRQVTVSLPDVNGREEILKVHSKKVKLEEGVDLAIIARGTPGFSGAELANLINEAALLAARKSLNAITLAELEEARDKVRWGRERRSMAMSDKEKIGTAWHEAGHAYLHMVLPDTNPLHKVTIIPRGPYLGATMYLPEGDKYSTQKKEALANLVAIMGGRIAETFYSDDVSNGASGDIRQATAIARSMVCEWGMSDKLGMVEYGSGEDEVFLARDMAKPRTYSEQTGSLIDAEIKRFIDEAYEKAKNILTENRDKVELIANALLEYETLDKSHIDELLESGEIKNPPRSPEPPELPMDGDVDGEKKPSQDAEEEGDGPLPGEIVGAPA